MNAADQNEPKFRVGDIVSFTGTVVDLFSTDVLVRSHDGYRAGAKWFSPYELTLVERPKPKRTVELDEEAILALWDQVDLDSVHPTLLDPIADAVKTIKGAL